MLRIRIYGGGKVIMGPGRAELLGLIQTAGSIAGAGRQMGMSYKRAWALVEAMNSTFTSPLVEAMKGGAGGGGAKLTALGIEVLAAYGGLQAAAETSGAPFLQSLAAAMAVPPGRKTS